MTEAERLNGLTERIIGCAIAVHHELGPGMLESAYESCLALELTDRQLPFQRQLALPFTYRGRRVPTGFRLDFLVDRSVVVEVKAVGCVDRVHLAQVRSYLQQTGCKVGLLINFNVKWLVENGIIRIVNNFPT